MVFKFSGGELSLDRVRVMGILNVTPDSFSDGGKYFSHTSAIERAEEIEQGGADIIDVGGQSTRPGYTPVPWEEEWGRLEHVLPEIIRRTSLPVSVDTFYPEVAKRALDLGTGIINDVSGAGEEMLKLISQTSAGLVLMFPQGSAGGDVLNSAREFFLKKIAEAENLGIEKSRLCLDPGIGFGKENEENLRLISNVSAYRIEGLPCLIGASRKRVTGYPCGNPPFSQRLPATIAAHTAAILSGADIVRVHDVKEGVQAARMAEALRREMEWIPSI